jgi:hypothetical protein
MNEPFTAEMAQIVARQERERIIKLLESKSECKPESGHDWNGDCYCEVIALIKGENK